MNFARLMCIDSLLNYRCYRYAKSKNMNHDVYHKFVFYAVSCTVVLNVGCDLFVGSILFPGIGILVIDTFANSYCLLCIITEASPYSYC